jgi:hypothetical protein
MPAKLIFLLPEWKVKSQLSLAPHYKLLRGVPLPLPAKGQTLGGHIVEHISLHDVSASMLASALSEASS